MYKKGSDSDYVAEDEGSANEQKRKPAKRTNLRLNKKEMIETAIQTFLPEGVTLSKMQALTSPQYQELLALSQAQEFSLNYKTFLGKVVKVSDGDTIKAAVWLNDVATKFTFRLGGIDTPQTRKGEAREFGRKVKQVLTGMIDQKIVKIEAGAFDKYGRILARIYTFSEGKELSLNDFLLENEMAKSYAGKAKLQFTSEDEDTFLNACKSKLWPKTTHYPQHPLP